jgi:hypothetical protein
MANIPTGAKGQFFSQRNEMMLQNLLTDDFKRRLGTDLNDKEATRLGKTVEYYMKQVYENPDNTKMSVQALNKEVLQVVVPDFMSYVRRQAAETDPLRSNVANRFEQLQSERQNVRPAGPAAPNFQLTLDDDGPSSVTRFEELRRIREEEAKRLEDAQNTLAPLNEDMLRRNQSDDDFRLGLRDSNRRRPCHR